MARLNACLLLTVFFYVCSSSACGAVPLCLKILPAVYWRDLRYRISLQTMRITALVLQRACWRLWRQAQNIAGRGNSRIAGPLPGCGESMPWAVAWFGPAAPAAPYCAARTQATSGNSAPRRPARTSWTSALSGPGTRKRALALSSGPGDQSRLYQTTDGCNSWKLLFTNPDAAGFWDGLLFLNRQQGVIYGDPVKVPGRTDHVRFGLLVTQDGGKTWSPGAALEPLPGESAFAASNSAMTASGGLDLVRNQQGEGAADQGPGHMAERTNPAGKRKRLLRRLFLSVSRPKARDRCGWRLSQTGGGDRHRGLHLGRRRTLEHSWQAAPWVPFCRGLGRKGRSLDHGG